MKFYYQNVLFNQNIIAKPNIVWTCDITTIELNSNTKFYIFLCIDIYTNNIMSYCTSHKDIKSQAIVKSLSKAIKRKLRIIPKTKLILHSDRGTQFSSKCYNNFTKEFEKFIVPSMSRKNTPTDNAVAERFMRTFKEYKINGRTIEQSIQEAAIIGYDSGNKNHRSIVNKYIASLNQKPNKKSLNKSPEQQHKDASIASILMQEPLHPKAFSERYGTDNRRDEISKFKSENSEVVRLLKEIASKKAEIVDRTPFDHLEGNIALELVDQRLTELYELIESNQYIVQNSVEGAIEPVNNNVNELREQFSQEMEVLNNKIDMLLPKNKREHKIQPLRDPIDNNLLPIFLTNAGNSFQRKKDLITAQLRITYIILFHVGLRINEIRHLKQEDLQTAIDAAQFNLVHHKTKEAHIHVLSKKAVQDLQDLKLEFFIVFEKYQYKYLFGKERPITDKNLIKMVNKDLKNTCKKFKIPFNIKSHSFRVNMITSLLKVTSVQKTASIIGHADIRSTMSYNRYALTKTEIQDLLDKINQNKK